MRGLAASCDEAFHRLAQTRKCPLPLRPVTGLRTRPSRKAAAQSLASCCDFAPDERRRPQPAWDVVQVASQAEVRRTRPIRRRTSYFPTWDFGRLSRGVRLRLQPVPVALQSVYGCGELADERIVPRVQSGQRGRLEQHGVAEQKAEILASRRGFHRRSGESMLAGWRRIDPHGAQHGGQGAPRALPPATAFAVRCLSPTCEPSACPCSGRRPSIRRRTRCPRRRSVRGSSWPAWSSPNRPSEPKEGCRPS
jgi:hypothetical protein